MPPLPCVGPRRPPSLPGHGGERGKWSASPHSGRLLCMKESPLSLKGICLLASPRLASLSCYLLRIQNRFGSVHFKGAKRRINGIVGTFKWHSWGYLRPHSQQLVGVGECHGGNLAFPVVRLPRLDSSPGPPGCLMERLQLCHVPAAFSKSGHRVEGRACFVIWSPHTSLGSWGGWLMDREQLTRFVPCRGVYD